MFHFERFLFFFVVFETTRLMRTPLYGVGATDSLKSTHMVTRDECLNAENSSIISSCCQNIDLDDEPARICLQVRVIAPPTDDRLARANLIATAVECIYKKRNYIKSKNRLNMGAIKAQAKNLYHNDSLKKDFFLNMYRFCGREATKTFNSIQNQPRRAELLKVLHHAYYFFVFVCTQEYSKAKCPYFRWKNNCELNVKNCEDYANQCKDKYFKNPKMYSINKETMPIV